MGTVIANTTQNAADLRLLFNFLPNDGTQVAFQIPWIHPIGQANRPRLGMFVAVSYMNGSPRYGYGMGHSFNNDTNVYLRDVWAFADDGYPDGGNGITCLIPNIDDDVYYHHETGAFIRFRSVGGSPDTAGPLGGPARVEVMLRSTWEQHAGEPAFYIEEYPLDGVSTPPVAPPAATPPVVLPPPMRAKFGLNMPAGTTVAYDEPTVGVSTLNIVMPNSTGATIIDIGPDGRVNITTSNDVTVQSGGDLNLYCDGAGNVNVGDSSGTKRALAYQDDLDELWSQYNLHKHTGVTTGGGTSLGTTNPATGEIGGTTLTVAD